MQVQYLTPELSSSVLLTIDMQRDFLLGGPFEISGTSEVLPRVIKVAQAYRGAGLPIVHAVRLYSPGSSDVT